MKSNFIWGCSAKLLLWPETLLKAKLRSRWFLANFAIISGQQSYSIEHSGTDVSIQNWMTFWDSFSSQNMDEVQKNYQECLTLIFLIKSTYPHRSSLPDVFCKRGVRKNFAKFTGKYMCLLIFESLNQSTFTAVLIGLTPLSLAANALATSSIFLVSSSRKFWDSSSVRLH